MKQKQKKLSSYQKQKALIERLQKRNDELVSDIRKLVVDLNIHKHNEWAMIFRCQDDLEKAIWNGSRIIDYKHPVSSIFKKISE